MSIPPKPARTPNKAGRQSARLSRRLAWIAILFWFASLPLPAIALFDDYWTGWFVLQTGWITVPSGLPAWLANLFFGYAIFRLIADDTPPFFSSFIALIFSLTTFYLFHTSDGYHGSGNSSIYGLGWGGLVWLTAMLLPFIASGIRLIEMDDKPVTGWKVLRDPLSGSGTMLLALLLVGSAVMGIRDHVIAHGMEYKSLPYAVFKWGPVCSTPDVQPKATLLLDGPLELVLDDQYRTLLTEPDTLLSWGIPTVRLGKWDYYLADLRDARSVVMVPAKGPVGARLEISHQPITEYRRAVHAKLTSADGQILGFDGIWRKPGEGAKYYCPRYSDSPGPREPPRSLLLETLRAPKGARWRPAPRGTVPPERRFEDVQVVATKAVSRKAIVENRDCPPDIGVRHRHSPTASVRFPDSTWTEFERPDEVFQVGDRLYWGSWSEDNHELCAGTTAYIYRLERYTDNALTIEPHQIPSFKRDPFAWRIRVPLPEGANKPSDAFIQALRSTGEAVELTVALFERDAPNGWQIELVARPTKEKQ